MYAAKLDSENELVILDDGSVKIFRKQGDVIALSNTGAVKLADCLNKIIPNEQSVWAKKLEAAVDDAGRMMEQAQAERNVAQGKLDDLREMAQELKRQYASYRYADSVGCAVEWQGENGEDYRKLESALMNRLIGEK